MIRQLCPHCLVVADLPATAAGTAVPCPKCGQPIPVPAGYVPTVAPTSTLPPLPESPPVPDPSAPPAPPPGFVPPKSPPAAAPAPAPVVTLPHWLAWLPAVGLTVALLASFFPWVGSYPGGVRVYTQSPWQAAVGTFSTAILPDGLTDDEAGLRAVIASSGWLMPYLPLLLVGVLLAWAERLLPDAALAGLPPRLRWLARLGPHRQALLAGVCLLTLVFVGLQTWRGYGLERAAQQTAAAKFADQEKAAGSDTNRQRKVQVLTGFEANRLGVQGATALDAALLAHLLAAAGAAGRWWLHRRGDRPLPRLTLTRG